MLRAISNVYAVEGLEQALALRPSLSAVESVVTRDGIWLGSNWLRVARDKDASAGVLKRKQELETIASDSVEVEKQIGELESQRQNNENQLQARKPSARNCRQHIPAAEQLR